MPLCRRHLTLVRDFVDAEDGVEDLLPSPCPACGNRTGVHYPSGWLCTLCEWRYGDVPDETAPTYRVDVVYYVRFDDRVKIGTSADPRRRLAAIWHDELLAFERGGRALERRRHAQFAQHRLGGEWFALADDLADHVRTLATGVDDPWDLYARWRSSALAASV